MTLVDQPGSDTAVLLFNDECAVCRHLARWVEKSAASSTDKSSIVERPIGDDPEALRALNEDLDIWDAYETIHVLMPDGTMKVGGEACAEVLRRLPNTSWFAGCFAVDVHGVRPFQRILDLGYAVLSDVRPILGCESCGTPSGWLKPVAWTTKHVKSIVHAHPVPTPTSHFTAASTR